MLKSNARDLVNVKFSAEKVLVSVLVLDNSGGIVILTVEVFENVAGSGLVVLKGTLKVSDVVSVVASVVNANIEGRVLIPVSNLVEVVEISMLGGTEEFVLIDTDCVTLGVVVIVLIVSLGVKIVVVSNVMLLAVEVSDLGWNVDLFIDSSGTGMVEVVIGGDNRVEWCLVTVVEAVLLGSGGEDFVVLSASVDVTVMIVAVARVEEVIAVVVKLNSASVTGGLIPA